MKKIGLFFGSFNPIHIGHLIIANYIVENTELNQIWFVVSPQNPLKNKATLLNDYQRLTLVKIAIEDNPKFKACDIEFKMPTPSYTYLTLQKLRTKHPKYAFALIMGMDNLATLNKWKNYKEITENHKIFVYPRNHDEVEITKFNENIILTQAPKIEISSSFIRQSIKNNKDVKYLLSPEVYNYVK